MTNRKNREPTLSVLGVVGVAETMYSADGDDRIPSWPRANPDTRTPPVAATAMHNLIATFMLVSSPYNSKELGSQKTDECSSIFL